jgi:formylglycine-generating enzyme required for sulfatase activity
MKKHMGSKVAFGLLAIMMIGALSIGATSALAGKNKKNDDMVSVPAGKFIYGKVYAKQEVDLPAFKIDKYEVTNEKYAKVVKDFKYVHEEEHFPVVFVSLNEAEAYCNAVGKRLPTQEEWEKAARGTDGRLYPWGDEFDETAAVTSETTAEGQKAREVGSREKGKSPYGAMDMAGNVWEWTSSYDERYNILRGGSYYEGAWAAQAISHLSSIPEDGKEYVGFRCVKDGK